MPCGKRPLIKTWDKSRNIKVITPSRYEQNEASVKVHWKNVIRDLELSYKDEQFWESQCDTVRGLVGPVVYERIAKIFNLPLEATPYVAPEADDESIVPSERYYKTAAVSAESQVRRPTFSLSDFELSVEEEAEEEVAEESWSASTQPETDEGKQKTPSSRKSIMYKSLKSLSRIMPSKIYSKMLSKTSGIKTVYSTTTDSTASSIDELLVQHSRMRRSFHKRRLRNPHFDMLYCNESETDMIKWNSKYKQKAFEVSASDEFSKKAEIMTKQISNDFYDWWIKLGSVEFKSDIKRPEDIEDLFQVWFDEHASRSLVLDPKILPCVLQSIAKFVGEPRTACPSVLKRQIAYDIHAETSPAHVLAFNTNLPQKMKHIPPNNNTKKMWHCVQIPEDLRTMSYVWDDIDHLTSTKAFHSWLQQRPHLPIPSYLRSLGDTDDKKQLFVVPSDFVGKERSVSTSTQTLALPVSQFNLELKDVLSRILNH